MQTGARAFVVAQLMRQRFDACALLNPSATVPSGIQCLSRITGALKKVSRLYAQGQNRLRVSEVLTIAATVREWRKGYSAPDTSKKSLGDIEECH